MSRRNWFLAAILVVVTVAAVPLVYGRPGWGHGPRGLGEMGMFGHLGKIKHQLDLSDQQVDEIKAIVKELREQNAPYREQLRGGIESIARTLLADPANTTAAQVLIDQQASAERALKQNVLHATSRALSVLTPEQRTRLGTMLDEHKARHRSRESR